MGPPPASGWPSAASPAATLGTPEDTILFPNPGITVPMDNIRLLLVLSLGAVLFLIYQAWVQDYGQPAPTPLATTTERPADPSTVAVPESDTNPATPADLPAPPPTAAAATDAAASVATASDPAPIVVRTDVLTLEISPRGGTINNLWLHDYHVTADDPDQDFQLLKAQPPNMFIAQSGLLGRDPELIPNHNAIFKAEQTKYTLADDSNELTVELTYGDPSAVLVTKRYRFTRGSYVIELSQDVSNGSATPISLWDYSQLQRTPFSDPNEPRFVRTYTGAVYYGPELKYKKEDFEEIVEKPLDIQVTDGWIAMIQHYFIGAWIPPEGVAQTFYTMDVSTGVEPKYIIGRKATNGVSIPPGGSHNFTERLYAGPKLQDHLDEVAPGLRLAVDYGWLTVIAEPIFWLLELIHSVVGNWGWSIIILTILIKGAFYKLSETSYKSMANMRQVAPRLKALKDRYGDDKERLNQAMMELYKKEKINPLGGCLPILVQIPVFIALYWVLLESVELRHAPFMLWLDNLTAPDPYYVLPLIMGVSMFIQQKLNPPPPDPMQEKIMMALPFVFTVFFAFFPSGLVLYWTVNQLLSIAQQWHITRNIEQAAAKRRAN
jgi:YidC/Oxa1 family membrane protein insertase